MTQEGEIVKIMILNVIKVRDEKCVISYCMNPLGTSEAMKGYIIINEETNQLRLFDISPSYFGKWIKVDIQFSKLKNNKQIQSISDYLLYNYVL